MKTRVAVPPPCAPLPPPAQAKAKALLMVRGIKGYYMIEGLGGRVHSGTGGYVFALCASASACTGQGQGVTQGAWDQRLLYDRRARRKS
jgi:hypothetical protein